MRTAAPTIERPQERGPSPEPRPARTLLIAIGGLLLAGLLAIGAVLLLGPGETEEPTPPPVNGEDPAPEIRFGEEPRANWDVTGVPAGEALDVFAEPGGEEAIATLAHDAVELESTGRIAWVDETQWREIIVPGATAGWVPAAFLTEHAPPVQPEPEIRYSEEPRANWDVTGVAADDVLNVRTAPGVGNPVIATLAHDTVELESTGRIAQVGSELWREIIVPGATAGWVNARFLTEHAPPALPAAVAATASAIAEAARAQDWDALAALAMAEPTTFTASYGEDFTSQTALAAFWRERAAEEPLHAIVLGLIGLPDWFVVTASDGRGNDTLMYVTPRFHHEATTTNRTLLEQAIGADRVAAAMVGGQYLGWRIGITSDGDWRFLVSGD